LNREDFYNRAESISTKKGYHKALKKLDSYLELKQLTESKFLELVEGFAIHQRYNLLQELIDHIKLTVSPRVARNYFESIFMYFVLMGLPLDYTQKRIRLKFPRAGQRRFEGLDKIKIIRILNTDLSLNFRAYVSALYGGGLRETEALLLTPSMFSFHTRMGSNELDEDKPTRLKLPSSITKFNIERETFLSPKPSQVIYNYIQANHIRADQLIFIDKYNEDSLIPFEKTFARIRKKVGLDTPNRKAHQQNDITLHSFRAWFITTMIDNDLESFGYAITGHSKYMDTYYRKSLDQRINSFMTVQDKFNF
jgi:hypothetical protein